MRTAVVLSGGGAKGAYEAGVLKALEDNRVQVDLVIGTSAGALNALFYALGETDRLYNAQGTGLWQRMGRSSILREGLLSTFYSQVVSWKLAVLAFLVSILNLLFFVVGFSLAFFRTVTLRGGHPGVRVVASNYGWGILYGLLVLVLVLSFEYLFMGSVVHTVYHWLKIKLGLTPINDESLGALRSAARRIPSFTKKLLTRFLRLPAGILEPGRLVDSIHEVEPPAYFSSGPLEQLLREEVRQTLQERAGRSAEIEPSDLGLVTAQWMQSRLNADDPRFRGLMVTATDLNAKTECLFFGLRDSYRRELTTHRLKRYDLTSSELFIHSQFIDHNGPDYVDLFFEENGRLLFDALIASTSIIGVFPPRRIKLPAKGYWRSVEPPHTFVDGGFGNNTPIRDAIEAGATHLIVVQVEPKNLVEPLSTPEELNGTLQCLLRTVETVLDTTVDDDYRYYELWNKYAPMEERVHMSIIQPRSSLYVSTLDFDGGLSSSGTKVPLSAACARGYSDTLKQFIYTDWPRWREHGAAEKTDAG